VFLPTPTRQRAGFDEKMSDISSIVRKLIAGSGDVKIFCVPGRGIRRWISERFGKRDKWPSIFGDMG
jgi:hypothetical protein